MKRLFCAVIPLLFLVIGLLNCAAAAAMPTALHPPKNGIIKVAFVLSEGAVAIDFAGPWDVFGNVMLPGEHKDMADSMPFELYTVGPSKAPIHTSGSRHVGIAIIPAYDFSDAPMPDLVRAWCLSRISSKVYLTSAEVNGVPSCHLTFGASWKV